MRCPIMREYLRTSEMQNKEELLSFVTSSKDKFIELCDMRDDFGYAHSPLHLIKGLIIRNYADELTQEEYCQIRKDLDVDAMRAPDYWKKTAKQYENPNFDEINTFRLYTSNFCPMNCAFCTLTRLRKYACGKHTPIIYLTANQCVELVLTVLRKYPTTRQIFFVDDDFLIIKQRGVDFCKKIIELKDQSYFM